MEAWTWVWTQLVNGMGVMGFVWQGLLQLECVLVWVTKCGCRRGEENGNGCLCLCELWYGCVLMLRGSGVRVCTYMGVCECFSVRAGLCESA